MGAPRAGFLWITGRWDWQNGNWQWVPGHWERERANMMWISGRWEAQGGRWIWVEGRWDARAAMRCRPQPHDLRPEKDRPVVGVAGDVVETCED